MNETYYLTLYMYSSILFEHVCVDFMVELLKARNDVHIYLLSSLLVILAVTYNRIHCILQKSNGND